MGRPVKIKKAKSFMFTTKHSSFSGIMGIVLMSISIIVMGVAIYSAFLHQGNSNVIMGSEGFFALILNFIGLIAGITALSERDIHKWQPVFAIIGNGIVLALWLLLVIWM